MRNLTKAQKMVKKAHENVINQALALLYYNECELVGKEIQHPRGLCLKEWAEEWHNIRSGECEDCEEYRKDIKDLEQEIDFYSSEI